MNKVIQMGRLVKDPELRYTTTNNTACCNFTLAVNRRFAKDSEQKADFIPVVAWTKLAEFCGKYFAKGMQVAIVGRLQQRTWDDTEGKRHYVMEVVADEAYFADGKREKQEPSNDDSGGDGFYPVGDSDELPF